MTKPAPLSLFTNETLVHRHGSRIAIACEGSAGFTQTGAIAIAIDKMAVATAPADFEFARTGQGGPGRWVMVADATAAGGRAMSRWV